MAVPQHLSDYLSSITPHQELLFPVNRLLSVIYYLPLSWRKAILDTCRIQACPFENSALQEIWSTSEIWNRQGATPLGFPQTEDEQNELLSAKWDSWRVPTHQRPTVASFLGAYISVEDICRILSNSVVQDSLMCSVVAYFVTSEAFYDVASCYDLIEGTVQKEITASQQEDRSQQFNYSFMSEGGNDPVVPNGVSCPNLSRAWVEGIDLLKRRLAPRTGNILLPSYNRRKNTGYETQYALMYARGGVGHSSLDYGPSDLLRHYHETGEQIGVLRQTVYVVARTTGMV